MVGSGPPTGYGDGAGGVAGVVTRHTVTIPSERIPLRVQHRLGQDPPLGPHLEGLPPGELPVHGQHAAELLALGAGGQDLDLKSLLPDDMFKENAERRVKLGLVLADELVQVLSENPGSYKLSNVILGACTVELPNCNSNTLIVGATSATWLWADDHWLAYGGQNQLGSLARGRAQNNPF